MKTLHVPLLRAEAKRGFRQRQLPRRASLFLAISGVFWPLSLHPAEGTAREELTAARLLETALESRHAGPEDLRQMERIFSDLVTRYPADAAVKNAQAEFFWSTGRHPQALEGWLAAEQLDPANAVVLDHLGGSFMAAGNARQAAAYFARAAASAPENAIYHFNYANVAFLFRRELVDAMHPDADSVLRNALTHFADASRLQPLNPEFARAYAEAFYTVLDPDWQAALEAWRHLYEISPGKDFALINMARVHMKLGNKPEARASLARVQGPEFDRLKARLRERIETE